jgi:hypothetical protein
MHMNGRISIYNVIKLFRHDINYSNLLLPILGHLRYNKFYSPQNSQNIMNKIYSTFWDYFHSLTFYVTGNNQKSFLVHF